LVAFRRLVDRAGAGPRPSPGRGFCISWTPFASARRRFDTARPGRVRLWS